MPLDPYTATPTLTLSPTPTRFVMVVVSAASCLVSFHAATAHQRAIDLVVALISHVVLFVLVCRVGLSIGQGAGAARRPKTPARSVAQEAQRQILSQAAHSRSQYTHGDHPSHTRTRESACLRLCPVECLSSISGAALCVRLTRRDGGSLFLPTPPSTHGANTTV